MEKGGRDEKEVLLKHNSVPCRKMPTALFSLLIRLADRARFSFKRHYQPLHTYGEKYVQEGNFYSSAH